MSKTPKVNAKLFAQGIKEGKNMYHAAVDAGMSPKQARKGKAAISGPMMSALAKEGLKFADLANEVSIEQAGKIATGRLIENCITGSDKGAMSAKILGSHRAINLWTPESQVGVIVLNAPQSALDKKEEMLSD